MSIVSSKELSLVLGISVSVELSTEGLTGESFKVCVVVAVVVVVGVGGGGGDGVVVVVVVVQFCVLF